MQLAGCALLLVAASVTASQREFTVSGHAARPEDSPMAGGAFVLTSEVVPSASPLGDGYALAQASAAVVPGSPTGSLCFCGAPLFADGFESGGTGAWSAAVP